MNATGEQSTALVMSGSRVHGTAWIAPLGARVHFGNPSPPF